jgi:hypothetical protein
MGFLAGERGMIAGAVGLATAVNISLMLGLIDIKSLTLSTLLSELGLAEPERYTWNIMERDTTGLTCPNFIYLVV